MTDNTSTEQFKAKTKGFHFAGSGTAEGQTSKKVDPLAIPEPIPLNRVLSLYGKTVVVTGGSRGLGEAIVQRLAEAGATVIFTGRNMETLKLVEDQVKKAGGRAMAVEADISNTEDSRRVIDLAIEKYGRVDILVNNAAVFQPSTCLETSEKLWDQTLNTDLKGAFFISQMVAQSMITGRHGGRIINLLSVDAFRPMGMLVAYDAAKAGLAAVTRSMAKELAEHNILVNAVVPGATITAERLEMAAAGELPIQSRPPEDAPNTREKLEQAMAGGGLMQRLAKLPLGRPGFPMEIADAVLFFASGLSSYVSGVCLTVDGAQSLG